jgi:septum site-determining protein MinD
MNTTKPKLINVVSGKGGTGKSLLCAVLARMVAQEGAKVLLVDFDLFVRGLSHFYYLFSKEKRNITNDLTVSEFYGLAGNSKSWKDMDLSKERFYEVDILPAVSEIEAQLDYLEIECETVLKTKHLLKQLSETDYDYIFIDNRAGVDELIIETSRYCEITISVSESDPISKTTNENLLRHLDSNKSGKVYTVINKMKFLRSFDDYQEAMERISSDFNIIGQIPFDVDLFEKFGTERFWDNANSTRYAYALAETWNKLSNREEMRHPINMKRFPRHELWPGGMRSPVFLNKFERMSVLLSVIFLASYFMYDFMLTGEFELKDTLLIYGVLMLAMPIIRRLVFWDKDKPNK